MNKNGRERMGDLWELVLGRCYWSPYGRLDTATGGQGWELVLDTAIDTSATTSHTAFMAMKTRWCDIKDEDDPVPGQIDQAHSVPEPHDRERDSVPEPNEEEKPNTMTTTITITNQQAPPAPATTTLIVQACPVGVLVQLKFTLRVCTLHLVLVQLSTVELCTLRVWESCNTFPRSTSQMIRVLEKKDYGNGGFQRRGGRKKRKGEGGQG